MGNGIPILGTVTKKCLVEQVSKNSFKIILTQGLNRQIRRMCEYLNYEVTKLVRTRIMNVNLAKLAEGTWRELSEEEMQIIIKMVAASSKTEEASKNTSNKKTSFPKKPKFIPKNNTRFKPNSKRRR